MNKFKRGKKSTRLPSPIDVLTRVLQSAQEEMDVCSANNEVDRRERMRDLAFDIHKAIRILEDKNYPATSLSFALKCILVVATAVSVSAMWYIVTRFIFGG
jgi:hypothetical protein